MDFECKKNMRLNIQQLSYWLQVITLCSIFFWRASISQRYISVFLAFILLIFQRKIFVLSKRHFHFLQFFVMFYFWWAFHFLRIFLLSPLLCVLLLWHLNAIFFNLWNFYLHWTAIKLNIKCFNLMTSFSLQFLFCQSLSIIQSESNL